jgi:DNA repair exonuclease SbcCD ATPase subunit
LKRLEAQLQQQKVEENWKKRVKEELVSVYRQLALYEQTKAREKVAQDILRLGQVTLERYTLIKFESLITLTLTLFYIQNFLTTCCFFRHGTELVEVWQDGYAFKELKRKLEANEAQKNELEKLKKQLTKKKNAIGNYKQIPSNNNILNVLLNNHRLDQF